MSSDICSIICDNFFDGLFFSLLIGQKKNKQKEREREREREREERGNKNIM